MARPLDPERSAARRETIILAAAELFAAHGFEQTTASHIAAAAGISTGSVFYYFGDKRAVFRGIFERDLPQSRELVERALARDDPLESILLMVDDMAASTLDPSATGLLIELLRQADKDPELMRVVGDNATIVVEGLARLIERAILAGQVDATLEPGEAAQWIQSIIDGAYLNADPDRDPRPMLRRIVRGFLITPTDREES